MHRIAAAARSERGQREANEDRVGLREGDGRWVAIVADGAGGHKEGAEAARRAVVQLEATLHDAAPPFDPASLTDAVLAAHASVQGQAPPADAIERRHTTAVVLWIDAAAGAALWSHVGDSRLYRARAGRLDLLTSDDSVVQRLVEEGVLTPEQARTHPRKNQLLSALGIDEEVHPHTLAGPAPLQEGDAYLLCSDGWWGTLEADDIVAALAQAGTPGDWLDEMGRRIEALHVPGQDNFSAIGVWVGSAGGGGAGLPA
jgi:serine/threonine protein phosphatase PrpC